MASQLRCLPLCWLLPLLRRDLFYPSARQRIFGVQPHDFCWYRTLRMRTVKSQGDVYVYTSVYVSLRTYGEVCSSCLLVVLAMKRAAILSLCRWRSSRITVQSSDSLSYFSCSTHTHRRTRADTHARGEGHVDERGLRFPRSEWSRSLISCSRPSLVGQGASPCTADLLWPAQTPPPAAWPAPPPPAGRGRHQRTHPRRRQQKQHPQQRQHSHKPHQRQLKYNY